MEKTDKFIINGMAGSVDWDMGHICHSAHSREEQGHADEDVNSNNSL